MTVPIVAQKPLRRCLLLSGEPPQSVWGGGCGQAEVCSQTELCGEPKMITLVDAPIRERNAIEGVECCSLEDIPVLRCRKSQRGATSSSAKEIQWRPCSWTEEWPVWGPLTVGENQTCLLSCRP